MRDSFCDLNKDLLEVVSSLPALVYGIIRYLSRSDQSLQLLNVIFLPKSGIQHQFGNFQHWVLVKNQHVTQVDLTAKKCTNIYTPRIIGTGLPVAAQHWACTKYLQSQESSDGGHSRQVLLYTHYHMTSGHGSVQCPNILARRYV